MICMDPDRMKGTFSIALKLKIQYAINVSLAILK